MAETYANNVDRANDYLRNYRQDANAEANEEATNQLTAYYNKVKELRDKYSTESAEGGEEIAGAAAAHMIIGKAKDYYKKYTNNKGPNNQSEEDAEKDVNEDDGSGEQNLDDAGAKPEAATATEDAPTSAGDATGMGEGVDTGSGLGGEFTGRGNTALGDEVAARMRSRLQFLNNMDNAPPAGAGAADPNTTDLPRNAPEPAAQGGEEAATATEENPFSFSAFEGGRGAFQPTAEPSVEEAFGDLSNIPKPGTASAVMNQIDAEAATARGGNINRPSAGQGGGESTTTGAGDTDGRLDINSRSQLGDTEAGDVGGQSSTGVSTKGSIQSDPAMGGDETTGANLGADAAEEGAGAGAEAGGSALGDVAGAALDAVPFIGEAAAVIQGLIGIGEGIAHLFDPDPPKPKPPPVRIGGTPITAKFAAALPDADAAMEDTAGSMSAF